MTPEQALKFREDQHRHLLEKGTLLLTVTLETVEDAEQLMEWMYGTDKPMTSELVGIAWDQTPVSSRLVDIINDLKQAIQDGE